MAELAVAFEVADGVGDGVLEAVAAKIKGIDGFGEAVWIWYVIAEEAAFVAFEAGEFPLVGSALLDDVFFHIIEGFEGLRWRDDRSASPDRGFVKRPVRSPVNSLPILVVR